MNISRENRKAFADIALRVLARGICVVSILDKRVASDAGAFGNGFSFAIYAGTGDDLPGVRLKTEKGRFFRADTNTCDSDVTIRFKDVSGCIPVLTGKTSIAAAFAQHRLIVWGNINQAVALTRVIDITKTYLFPRFMLKNSMRPMSQATKKQVPSLLVYIMLLFFGSQSRPRVSAPSNGRGRQYQTAVGTIPLNASSGPEEELRWQGDTRIL